MTGFRDQLYAAPQAQLPDFCFDERVVAVFPDMIRRSVPGYAQLIALLGLLAARYVQPHSRVYDLGCSLGAATLALRPHCQLPGCQIVAVDSAAAMVAGCQANLAATDSPVPVAVQCADIRAVPIAQASLVVLNFTLQFIPPADRLLLLQRIRAGLLPGGALLLSEKICFDTAEETALQLALHHAYKRANGYSELEISQKRSALERVMIPETLAAHQTRLQEAGFAGSSLWFQCFNFMSLVAWV